MAITDEQARRLNEIDKQIPMVQMDIVDLDNKQNKSEGEILTLKELKDKSIELADEQARIEDLPKPLAPTESINEAQRRGIEVHELAKEYSDKTDERRKEIDDAKRKVGRQ